MTRLEQGAQAREAWHRDKLRPARGSDAELRETLRNSPDGYRVLAARHDLPLSTVKDIRSGRGRKRK